MTRAVTRLVRGATGLLLLGAVWWAFKPLPEPDLRIPSLDASAPAPEVARLAVLDTHAFATPLWVTPPAPPAPPPTPAPPPPPPPLKVQLIAIVQNPAAPEQPPSALFYDPDADRLVTLKEGDQIAGRTIQRITSLGVELREGGGTRTLALSDVPAPAGGTGGGR